TLRAPFGGKLGSRKVDVGAFVSGGETIVRLEDTSELQIEFRMPSEVAPRVKEGMPVRITLPGSDTALTGELNFIDPTVSTDTRSVLLRAVVANQGTTVRPGLFVRVALDLSVHQNALVVPVAAISSGLASAHVFVVDDKSVAHRVAVTLGLSDGEQVEVLSGLKAGQSVVTIGQFRLRDGDTVKVVPADVGQPTKGAT
ncbi:MAG: efflux RND transporter periplasmic adaptor subunit, partial [Rhodospirillales bacterium]|nr:efflux RND transporter periplasmic adaptor subunit [Rhodospirillales bacterium]